MPEPMTMLAMGSTFAGGVMQASSSIKGGKADRQVAEYNAKIRERNANMFKAMADHRRWLAGRQEAQLYFDARDFIKGQQVSYAKAGVATGTGTPLEVAMASVDAIEDKVRALQYNTEVEALGLREQAVNEEMQAALTRAGGRARQSAAKMQAFTSLLSSAGRSASLYR